MHVVRGEVSIISDARGATGKSRTISSIFEHEEAYTDAAYVRRIRRTGYHGANFHLLCHTQATVLIGGGADVKAVQDRL